MGYRSWIAWPYCWQNPGPSSLWSITPAAWKVSLSCKDWEDHVGFDCLKKKKKIQLCIGLLNVYRNSQNARGREHGALRGVHKGFFSQPDWGKSWKGAFLGLANHFGMILMKLPCFFFKLTPIISDPEYLLDQHILISVKSTDSYESYGNRQRNYNKLSYVKSP